MGKKTRSKQRKNNNNRNGRSDSKNSASNNNDTTSSSLTILVQRIRHSDPKICHAALSSSMHVQFDPSNLLLLTDAKTKKSIPILLLQAIREQILNKDLYCAIAAASCLSNYLAFYYTSNNNNNTEDDATLVASAGWFLVFIGRLKNDCIPQLLEQQQQHKKEIILWLELTEKCIGCIVHLLENNPYAIDRLLLRSSSSSTTNTVLRNDCMNVLHDLMRVTKNSARTIDSTTTNELTVSTPSDTVNTTTIQMETDNTLDVVTEETVTYEETSNTKTKTKKKMKKQQKSNHPEQDDILRKQKIVVLLNTIGTLSCRCFHTIMADDNNELIMPYMLECPKEFQRLIETTISLVSVSDNHNDNTNTVQNTITIRHSDDNLLTKKLHAIGALLSIWTVLQNNNHSFDGCGSNIKILPESISTVQSLLSSNINMNLIVLKQTLQNFINNSDGNSCDTGKDKSVIPISESIQQLKIAYDEYQKQIADKILERQVELDVSNKNESARSIARRHKNDKKNTMTSKDNSLETIDETTKVMKVGDSNNDMMDDDVDTKCNFDAKGYDEDIEGVVVDTEDGTNNDDATLKRSGKITHDRNDCSEVWESLCKQWNDTIALPIQLSLEIIANLTTITSQSHESTNPTTMMDDDDNDYDMITDDDGNCANSDNVFLDDELISLILQNNIPNIIYSLLCQLLSASTWAGQNAISDTQQQHQSTTSVTTTVTIALPDPIRQSCTDLQSKAAVCLGHCLMNIPPSSIPTEAMLSIERLWNDLFKPTLATLVVGVDHQQQPQSDVLVSTSPYFLNASVRQTLCSIAVSAIRLRSSSQVREKILNNDLHLFLSVIDTTRQAVTTNIDQMTPTRSLIVRDIINLLGSLCSQHDHTEQTNRTVCQSMISLGTVLQPYNDYNVNSNKDFAARHSYVLIVSEILNSLIDIYGNDECYPDIFDECDCLGYFQRSVVPFKKCIDTLQANVRNAVTNIDYYTEEDIDQWKEILLNSNRFIQYKKG